MVTSSSLSRRNLLQGLSGAAFLSVVGGVVGVGGGCKRSSSSTSGGAASSSPPSPRHSTYEGIEMIELFPNAATDTSPIVVFIHGMGGRPAQAQGWWTNRCPHRARVVLPRAFDAYGSGYSWFEFKDGMTDEQFGDAVGKAETRLWKGIAALAGNRKIIVTGFSQGGILSFAMASRHPDSIVKAFPISGSCPGPLLPQNKAHTAPLLAFHGTTDNVLELKWGREAVAAFKAQGNDAQIKEYEGIGHTITMQMRADLMDAIGQVIAQAT